MRTLTLFGQFEHHSEAFVRHTRNTDQLEARAVARQQGVLLASQVALALLTLTLFWQAFSLYGAAELGGAQLFMVLLLTLGVAEVLLAHIPAVANFRLGWRALSRLDQMAGGENTPDPRQFIRGERPAVMLNNVSYRYPAQKAATLTGITQKLTPGWHWLVGESGAGKSTLMGLLAGDLAASQGEVILAGVKGSVAVMPQQVDILRASLRQNVALHRTSSDKAIERALEQVGLSEWIETLPQGLDTWLGEGEWQPSGGEAKRIALARLLIEESEIILLDEPFAGLDAQRIDQLMVYLRKAWQGKVVIAVSHDHRYIDAQDSTLALRPH
ncbi:MAG: ATP-binding cassette domain-containing protein, partial [Porticoccaceae bacterium]|nr:ATP-binding cassette domain-containing protein [Porticoccaceae bacterium]